MSKITKALEKAARERVWRQHEVAVVTPKATALELAPVAGSIASAGAIQIDPHIVSATDPSSPVAEQYRILRTNLQALKGFSGPRILVITSSVHTEGKSVSAINLALTMAQQEDLNVLLIDADLRRGSIHHWLGLDNSRGLSTALQNGHGGNLEDAMVRLQSPPLAVMSSGPRPDQPAELLESSHMKRLLATLKTQFQVIIIDAPPVLPVTDPGILGALADGVLMVVRSGKTQRRVVLQAYELLKQSKSRLLGCILTHVDYYIPGYYRYYQYYRYASEKEQKDKSASDPSNGKSTSSTGGAAHVEPMAA